MPEPDLLARLRKPTYVTIDGVDCLSSQATLDMEEAADEIERLRAVLEKIWGLVRPE